MNDRKKRFLREVVEDARYVAYREGLWKELEGEFRREQWRRRVGPRIRAGLALAACVVVGVGIFVWVQGGMRGTGDEGRSYARVRTEPLKAGQVIRTMPEGLQGGFPVEGHGDVAKVKTAEFGVEVERILDEDLIRRFAGHSLALVDVGGRRALWFLDPNDEAQLFWSAGGVGP